ncbi:MAG: NAD(P)(+) transhydrogenase (Re/Si-specific) subunit alpha [Propionibacteriaceae bacterium]|jgi:NAD(P) transhydrogenase subunit alpha|nr:NAD(P)(+) transhydrogenase (Re/Si-specific) subunit alpha [Propionibacteriaceae bacterium]
MPVVVGVPVSSDPKERRSPIVPAVVQKLKGLGVEVVVERGATAGAYLDETSLEGVNWVDSTAEVLAASDVIWSVDPPSLETIGQMREGTILMGLLYPYSDRQRAELLASKKITAFASELIPRISRSQSMDVMSSQAACSGYQCVILAAARAPKFFPMLTYAAGTIRPSQVLVVGAGVAGLQAIATAHRLGAVVYGYDVRSEVKEQVESLGAKFVDVGVSAHGSGGYARELTVEEKALQAEKLAKAVASADVLITTAGVPGKRAPSIISESMVKGMKPGAVVIDMMAENGGNVWGTQPGQDVKVGNALVYGPVHLPSRMPVHASEMFSKNLLNFLTPMISDGLIKLDWEDKVVAGSCLTHDGQVVNKLVRQVLGFDAEPDPTPGFIPTPTASPSPDPAEEPTQAIKE